MHAPSSLSGAAAEHKGADRDSGPAAGFPTLVVPMARIARLLIVLAALVCALTAPPARAAGPSATAAALERQMRSAGGASGAFVVDLDSGAQLYASRPDAPRVPASVEKLYTTSAAMTLFGTESRILTRVLGDVAVDPDGVLNGSLYLRGGGDPSFGAGQARQLAATVVAATGLREITGRVVGDESAFDALRGVPSSGFRLTSDVGPLSALTFNRGRTGKRRPYFQASPALFAAQAFERALRTRGVTTGAKARSGVAPTTAVALGEQASPTMAELSRRINVPSDNFAAETLLKVVGAEFGGAGTTTAGAATVRRTLSGFGLRASVVDGSGLSRRNTTSPRDVVGLLRRMADSEAAPAFEASLPVAGSNGTLSKRMRGTAAQGRCRAKTGTLRGVSTLAGYCFTTSGTRVAFAFLMNGVSIYGGRRLQDRMTVALARYGA